MAAEALPPPGVYTIPPGQPFLRLLARPLLAMEEGALADTLLLLPSRRTCLVFRETLLEMAGGRPLLLPRLLPVGEPEEPELLLDGGVEAALPPAIAPLRRRLLLARLLRAAEDIPFEQAVRLADALAGFLDEVQTEEADLSGLAELAPEEFAEHWQKLLRFLRILDRSWPAILAERGVIDPAERRRRLLDLQARHWRCRPPRGPLLAAGISGSIPAVARLLATVARIGGRVVLPGLDRDLDPADWRAVREDPTHPQHGLGRLLETMAVEPEAVRLWPGATATVPNAAAREGLWREIMRPAGTSERWSRHPRFPDAALAGLGLVEAPDLAGEALAVAVRLREVLETPGRRAMLVTTDRNLARRVAAELQRWRIPVEDSAGVPLDQSPPGSFLLLTAHLLVEGAAPARLLAAFKHPLARAGDAGAFRRRVRALERLLLRGPRPCGDLAELRALLNRRAGLAARREGDAARLWPVPVPAEELLAWLDGIVARARPFRRLAERPQASLADLLDAHLAFAEFLAADENGRPDELWAREAGQRASAFVAELAAAAEEIGELPATAYPALLAVLMGAETVRPQRPGHPRIAILGQFESRLLQADLVILGSLNEGHWPRAIDGGPWLNRRMREVLGLPPPEQRIGFAAHDLLLAASAPEVLLTRAVKDRTGAPTVASRWLQRLHAVLRAAGIDPASLRRTTLLEWASALDRHDGPQRPWPRPAPRPPAAARPDSFWASDIEQLMRDPYGFYARRILELEPLEPVDADPGAAERGMIVHEALGRFVEKHPGPLPEDALARMLEIGREIFARLAERPDVADLWWPRFERIAAWFVDLERRRRAGLALVASEIRGELRITCGRRAFLLRARADRIERRRDGGLEVIDYKTGNPPDRREVVQGFAPQLPVEGLIARAGGFPDLSGPVVALHYWRLVGDGRQDEARPVVEGEELETVLGEAERGLLRLLAHFADPATAFPPVPRPELAARFNAYDHLSRRQEWWGGEPTGEPAS